MRKVTVAAIQMQCEATVEENIKKADELVRSAAGQGANVILLPELFERPYFCQERRYDYYQYAKSVEENDAVKHFRAVAKALHVVLPISFYEKDKNAALRVNLSSKEVLLDTDLSIEEICELIDETGYTENGRGD